MRVLSGGSAKQDVAKADRPSEERSLAGEMAIVIYGAGSAGLTHRMTIVTAFTVVLLSVKMLWSGVVRPCTASVGQMVRRRGGVRRRVEFCGLPEFTLHMSW